jgi:hypothetical protein
VCAFSRNAESWEVEKVNALFVAFELTKLFGLSAALPILSDADIDTKGLDCIFNIVFVE